MICAPAQSASTSPFECWGLNEHLFFDPLPVQVVYAVPADETPVVRPSASNSSPIRRG